jgi:chromosomal replication initiation ATPase DnaA
MSLPSPPAGSAWRQLPLPFAHRPEFARADFIAAPANADALAWLGRVEDWPQARLALWGEAGCGKTHLLHVWSARHGAALLAGARISATAPPSRPLVIDDADTAGEQPLLHLLNATAEARQPVLLAAREPPARWRSTIPDLASRLRAITAIRIGPADETLLRALLVRLLAERQLLVGASVQAWLLACLPRTPGALREAVARLDHAALVAGLPITRAFAAATLGELLAPEEPHAPPSTAPALLL